MQIKLIDKRFFLFLILFIILTCLSPVLSIKAFAASEEEDVGFSVSAQIPSNQRDASVTYFDLLMTPNTEQTLEILVANTSSEAMEVEVKAITASTNRNGIIDYSTPDIKDSSMKVAFSEIAMPEEKRIAIPANSSKIARVKVKMPKESYDGVILGGITIQKVLKKDSENTTDSSEEKSSTVIYNRYNYVIGVKLTETDKEINPDFEMVSVAPTVVNYKKAITSEIRNKSALIIKDMKITAEVYKEGSSKVIVKNSNYKADMAPNSTIAFPIELEDTELSAGKYVSKVHIEWNNQDWDLEMPFEISKEELAKQESESVSDESSSTPFWVYLLIVLAIIIILLLVIIVILLLMKKSKKKESKNE